MIYKVYYKRADFLKNRIIFHIDVNSAYLSWQSVENIKTNKGLDLRKIPSIIGGNEKTRHGVVLAKSVLAKKFGIKTGESIYSARKKCRDIVVVPPNFMIYVKYSNMLLEFLREYTPVIEEFSIDECFLDFTGTKYLYKDYIKLAYEIKERIKKELGFTVNIGISHNKLLSKMAGDLEKPDKVHTIWKDEVKLKMWPLPVENLFMVGKATSKKLNEYNIYTIGDLAKTNKDFLKIKFKKHGELIWNYANGIENSPVKSCADSVKSIGNSITIPYDIESREEAHKVLLALSEKVSTRLRLNKSICGVISIGIKYSDFSYCSRQKKLDCPLDTTDDIINEVYNLFDKYWNGRKIRLLGITLSDLSSNEVYQLNMFSSNISKHKKLDKVIDEIRSKYGNDSIVRSTFIDSKKDR